MTMKTMTMKTMIIAASAFAIASIASAATPYTTARAVNLKNKETWQTTVTLATAPEIYAACKLTNDWPRAETIATIAVALGSQDLILDYASSVPNTCGPRTTNFDTWKLGRVTGAKGTFAWQQPELAFAIAKKFIERGDYENACILLFWIPRDGASWNPMLASQEVRAYIAEKYTPEVVLNLRYTRMYTGAIAYFAAYDKIELDDPSEPTVQKYWSAERARYVVENSNFSNISSLTKRNEFLDIAMNWSCNNNVRIISAKRLDAVNKSKAASTKLWPWILENGTFAQKTELAFYLNDADKILDAFKTIGTDATPDELNKFIPIVNGLDYKYRAAEVIDILKNINSKYTLKLYDDRDTWEPILSKVRAMIDAR